MEGKSINEWGLISFVSAWIAALFTFVAIVLPSARFGLTGMFETFVVSAALLISYLAARKIPFCIVPFGLTLFFWSFLSAFIFIVIGPLLILPRVEQCNWTTGQLFIIGTLFSILATGIYFKVLTNEQKTT